MKVQTFKGKYIDVMQKSALFLLILAALVTNYSCSKVNNSIRFQVKDQATIQIRSTVLVDVPLQVATPEITTNSNEEFENNNTRAELVKHVELEELKLSIIAPDKKTFSFLKSIHIFISTTDSDEIELAYLDNIPPGADAILLTTTDLKLDNYIKASSYKLRTEVQVRETLTENVDILTDVKFRVTANLF